MNGNPDKNKVITSPQADFIDNIDLEIDSIQEEPEEKQLYPQGSEELHRVVIQESVFDTAMDQLMQELREDMWTDAKSYVYQIVNHIDRMVQRDIKTKENKLIIETIYLTKAVVSPFRTNEDIRRLQDMGNILEGYNGSTPLSILGKLCSLFAGALLGLAASCIAIPTAPVWGMSAITIGCISGALGLGLFGASWKATRASKNRVGLAKTVHENACKLAAIQTIESNRRLVI